jgi:two-component system, NarL family, nitrate/nitrite response regulator NarL
MMQAPPLRILVVDDHPIVREGVRRILEAQSDFRVVGEAENGASAQALAARLRPDAAVVDVGLPDISGLALVRALRAAHPTLLVVMLSMYDDAEYVRESRAAGASGYVVKDSAATMLVTQLRLASGRARVAETDVSPSVRATVHLQDLTPRECDVLRGVALGQTNKAIGASLGISPRTVETHRERVIRKLGLASVAALTAFALDAGLVSREELGR